MKWIPLCIFCICIPAFALAQTRFNWISNIDNLVQQTDSLSNRSQHTFYLVKFGKNDRNIKETWHYSIRDRKVAIFQVRYIIDSIEYAEIYYLDHGRLIYSEEYETLNFSSYEDEIKWGGICYFAGNSLKQFAKMGYRRSRNENWDPQFETLNRFQKRYNELLKHIQID